MIERHIQVTYCDDIRHEVGAKVSHMGIYSTSLFVPSFPINLPKFCVSVKVVTPIQNPIESLTIQIKKDDDVLQELVVDDEKIAKSIAHISNIPNDESENRVQVFHAMTAFAPMVFDGPCILRVHAQTEDKELRGVGLKVEQQNTESKTE